MNEKMLALLLKIGAGVVGLIVVIWFVTNVFTTVDAKEIVVHQTVTNGALEVWTTPGPHFQFFGKITRYKKSDTLWFSAKKDEGKDTDDSIKVRFNDGGHGNLSGSIRYDLPTDAAHVIALHQKYGSMESIDHDLVRQVVNKSVYMTGPLMSSRESYAEKRNDLISFIADQIQNGVFRTEHKTVETVDPLTQQTKTVEIVQPKLGPGPGGIEREEEGPIQRYGIVTSSMTINSIDYEEAVEAQIKQQQQAIMAVQQSLLLSKKAEQDAITTKLQGEASAAKAKWDQEVIKATELTRAQQEHDVAVTQANKDKEVAALSLETAKLAAQQTVTEAKADSDAKRLATAANNNLQDRLGAYVDVQKAWAAAYGAQRQTPDVSLGGASGGGANAGMELLTMKLARDLGVTTHP